MNAEEEEEEGKWILSSNYQLGRLDVFVRLFFRYILHPSFRGGGGTIATGRNFYVKSLVILAAFRLYIDMNSNGKSIIQSLLIFTFQVPIKARIIHIRVATNKRLGS